MIRKVKKTGLGNFEKLNKPERRRLLIFDKHKKTENPAKNGRYSSEK